MTRKPFAAAVLTTLAAAVALAALGSAGAAPTSDPLVGRWDTGPFPMAKIRMAAHAAGYSKALITRFIGEIGMGHAKTVEVNLRFYRQAGVPYALVTGWDPTKGPMPSGGDHGPYKLVTGHRVDLRSADPTNKQRDTYRYRISNGKLRLYAIAETNPAFTRKQLRLDSVHLYFQTAAPFTKK
jgi:hypothetical protein